MSQRFAETTCLPLFSAKRLDDPMGGERFGAHVGHVLLRFLASPRSAADLLSEPYERVQNDGRACQAYERKPCINVEEDDGISHQRQRLAREVSGGFRNRTLYLADVVRYARQQLSDGIPAEEAGGLSEDMTVETIAHVHDDALSDVFHQITGKIRANAFQEI